MTIKQAKVLYHKHRPRLTRTKAREIARGAELMRRTKSIREAEHKRKLKAKRKAEKKVRD